MDAHFLPCYTFLYGSNFAFLSIQEKETPKICRGAAGEREDVYKRQAYGRYEIVEDDASVSLRKAIYGWDRAANETIRPCK